jgi:hypothetical protein
MAVNYLFVKLVVANPSPYIPPQFAGCEHDILTCVRLRIFWWAETWQLTEVLIISVSFIQDVHFFPHFSLLDAHFPCI